MKSMNQTPFEATMETYLMFPNIAPMPPFRNVTYKLATASQSFEIPFNALFVSFASSANVLVSLDGGMGLTNKSAMLIIGNREFTVPTYLRDGKVIDVSGNVGDLLSVMFWQKRGYTRL